MTDQIAQRTKCAVKDLVCREEKGRGPEFCTTQNLSQVVAEAVAEYDRPEVRRFARNASVQEAECYANRHISVMCKVGATPKEKLGLKEEEKVRIGQFETMCSPIVQAKILNHQGCEFNITPRPLRQPRFALLQVRRGADHGPGGPGQGQRPQPGRRSLHLRFPLRPAAAAGNGSPG